MEQRQAPMFSHAGRLDALRAFRRGGSEDVSRCLLCANLPSTLISSCAGGLFVHRALKSVRRATQGSFRAQLFILAPGFVVTVALTAASLTFFPVEEREQSWPCYAAVMAGRTSVAAHMRQAYRAAYVAQPDTRTTQENGSLELPRELSAALAVSASELGGSSGLRERGGLGRFFSAWLFSARSSAVFEVMTRRATQSPVPVDDLEMNPNWEDEESLGDDAGASSTTSPSAPDSASASSPEYLPQIRASPAEITDLSVSGIADSSMTSTESIDAIEDMRTQRNPSGDSSSRFDPLLCSHSSRNSALSRDRSSTRYCGARVPSYEVRKMRRERLWQDSDYSSNSRDSTIRTERLR